MALLEPMYKEYYGRSEQLLASFSEKAVDMIQRYFTQTTSLIEETIATLRPEKATADAK